MEKSRIRDVDSSDPGWKKVGSGIRTISIPYPWSSLKNLSILTHQKRQKKFSQLSKIGSGLFIPDPGSWCWLSPFPDPGVQREFNPGSRIRKHCKKKFGNKILHLNIRIFPNQVPNQKIFKSLLRIQYVSNLTRNFFFKSLLRIQYGSNLCYTSEIRTPLSLYLLSPLNEI